jgi:predicted dehydrogenase
MKNNKPIGVAIIGYGYWSPKLIRNMNANLVCSLQAICEKDISRHDRIREENPGIDVMQRYQDIFAREDIDAVIIATIPSSHFRIAKQALDAGKHILVEKPLVLSPAEGEILLNCAKQQNLVLMIDHTYLYSSAIQELKNLVRNGSLGQVYSIDSTRINLGLFQRDVNVIWDLAPHDFSLFLLLLEEKPIAISVAGSKTIVHPKQEYAQESVAHMMLHYQSGLTAHVYVSWVSPVKVRQITVVGSRGTAFYDQLASSQLEFFEQGVTLKEGNEEGELLFEYKTSESKPVLVPNTGEDIASMLNDFFRAVQTGSVPVSNAALGLDVVRLLYAAQRSLDRGGKKVSIQYREENTLIRTVKILYMKFRQGY